MNGKKILLGLTASVMLMSQPFTAVMADDGDDTSVGTAYESSYDTVGEQEIINRDYCYISISTYKLSEILNITQDELTDKLNADGISGVYEMLEDVGKVGEYKQYLLNEAERNFDKLVEAEEITEAEVEQLLQKAENYINNWSGESYYNGGSAVEITIPGEPVEEEYGEIYFSPYTLDKEVISGILGVEIESMDQMAEEAGGIAELLNSKGKSGKYIEYLNSAASDKLSKMIDDGMIEQYEANAQIEQISKMINSIWGNNQNEYSSEQEDYGSGD